MKKYLLISMFSLLLMAFGSIDALAQGVTNAHLSGNITDAKGEVLIGATVIAVHQPTGSRFGNVTNVEGIYNIRNMNVGGPYKITVSYVGYQSITREGVYLSLGQTKRINYVIQDASTELAEVVVMANTGIIDGNRTGAETVIGERQINEIPTVARAIGDFARLNPQANIQEGGDGFTISLGGMNNRFNTIFIDGAVNNDVFGLAGSGTNGGQTGASPISVDAIEQFQISIAPFDVRQSGFAGGAINAVTRSGTNSIEGSAYYFVRNEGLAGKTPTDNESTTREKLPDFSAKTYGVRIGGPIIKDKLFFFINAEIQKDETPQPFDFADYDGDASEADVNALISKLNGYGYDPGVFNNNTGFLNSNKFLVKFDWNINDNHKLSFRHSITDIENLEAVRSSNRRINFLNSSEFLPSLTNSSALELKSNFGNNISNQLIIGRTVVNDDRDPSGQNFPYVNIQDGSGSIFFGSERFSTANKLDQTVFTITNNLEIFKGRHTITLGTHNEFYKIENLFIPFNFGSYEFNSLNDFMTDQNSDFYIRSYSLRDNISGDGSKSAVAFSSMQLGFYVQDEFQVSNKLKLTGGLRVDIPVFEDTPINTEFNENTIPLLEAAGYDLGGAETGSFINSQLMIAPRIGFNYDVKGDHSVQLRGGVGIFNSRIPLVWPGGAYNNNGLNRGTILKFGDLPFNPNWADQIPGTIDPAAANPSGDIDLFVDNFKVPQVFKANLAIDKKLPIWGLVATVEGLYTKFLNNVDYQNLNLKPSTEKLTGTPDTRPIYNRRDEVDDTYGRILLGRNVSDGYAYNLTAQITKPYENGFSGSIAYTYGDSKTIYDGTSSQNSSQWRGLHTVGGRNFERNIARSDFSVGSRIIVQASYRKEWGGFAASQLSLFYNAQSGQPYSYIYNDRGRLTNEDSRGRSLIFVPASSSDINLVDILDRDDNVVSTVANQWSQLDAYISNDPYLSERRGQYAERNQNRAPFESILDLKISQEFFIETSNGKRNTLQLTLDIFNFSNFLNNKWGRRYFNGSFGNIELLNFEGFESDGTTPQFTFDGEEEAQGFLNIDDSGIRSARWQMQIGLRYTFQ